jgi:hypothetical protein
MEQNFLSHGANIWTNGTTYIMSIDGTKIKIIWEQKLQNSGTKNYKNPGTKIKKSGNKNL